MRTLVQKLRAGEQFLARGRIRGLVNAPGWVWAQVHFIYPITFYFASVMGNGPTCCIETYLDSGYNMNIIFEFYVTIYISIRL